MDPLRSTVPLLSRPESARRYVGAFLAAFPDLVHTVEELVAEGDTVVADFTAEGTQTGPWHGIAPTGKIVEHRTVWDTLAVLEQLGVVPVVRKEDGTRL